jgi:palmitoyl-protein thioesterase
MDGFMDEVRAKYPGIFVHSVVVPADGGVNDERNAGFVSRLGEAVDMSAWRQQL